MIQGLIFDFDGTLTELTLDFQIMKEEILRVAKRFINIEKIEHLNGLYIIEMIYEIERLLGIKGVAFSKEAFKRLESLEVEAAKGKDLFPYARDVLGSLRHRGMKLGIITRTCMPVLNKVFPDMDEFINGISTREHIKFVKPDPRHVYHVLKTMSIRPENAILAGDHPTDVLAGLRAGVITVGVLSGRTKRHAFEDVGAHFIIDDIRGILQIVENLLRSNKVL